jgi:starch phosphorylase
MERIVRALEEYLGQETWFDKNHRRAGGPLANARIGYFSMEFGIHECLPVYSGGLGVLAGDHLKSASDLGLPLAGVGIAFSQGYFRQRLDEEGWQGERYPPNDWYDLPVSPVVDERGHRVVVRVPLPLTQHPEAGKTRDVLLQAWRAEIGRVPLFLLDANLDLNAPEDRALTNTLYGGDKLHRVRQELLLGLGGLRLLHAASLSPTICHLNEGHSAFLALERVREIMSAHDVPFGVAREIAAAGHIFTTHTPVPAGNDGFPPDLVRPYAELLGAGVGMGAAEVMRVGRVNPDDAGGELSMPVLAIRLADRYNGVSLLHGREARRMWKVLWPGLPEHEVPIGSITNGVHLGTWIAAELGDLYRNYLGPGFMEGDPEAWAKVASIPDAELWHVHERCRARLIGHVRHHLKRMTLRKGRAADVARIDELLDPRALTLGFARRFATYKRGALLFRDAKRLERLLHVPGRPVQLLFSGKAHPQDWGGKELIRDIVRASQSDAFRGRIVFVEDYDMEVARALVSGVDVWLNTPRRPLEASGTSGMKAALNGALNASILDGWWAEAYAGDNGFAIGHGEEHVDATYGDHIEALALYRLLEEEVIPQFYDRDPQGLPRRWVARMKRSIQTIAPVFNTHRMVREYAEQHYRPAIERTARMLEGGLAEARALAAWRARLEAAWPQVRVEAVEEPGFARLTAGEQLTLAAHVQLGGLRPEDVIVEAYYGKLHGEHALPSGETTPLRCAGEMGGGRYRYEGHIPARGSGEHAFAVRVIPHHDALATRFAMHLMRWH